MTIPRKRRLPKAVKAKRRTVAQEKRDLQKLVRTSRGNLSEMARALAQAQQPITRQALTRKLDRLGLLVEADTLRHAAGVSGPRTHIPGGMPDPAAECQQLLDAAASAANYQAAADSLGIGRRTLFRRLRQFDLTPAKVDRRRQELAAQAAAPAA